MIHYKLIEQTGGSHGIRDLGLIESTINRPRSGMEEVEFFPTLALNAAALMQSLIHFHPFIDGNERTGMVAGIAFLNMNGLEVDIENQELEDFAVQIATENIAVEVIGQWIVTDQSPQSDA